MPESNLINSPHFSGIDVLCSMTSENNKLQSKLNSLAPKVSYILSYLEMFEMRFSKAHTWDIKEIFIYFVQFYCLNILCFEVILNPTSSHSFDISNLSEPKFSGIMQLRVGDQDRPLGPEESSEPQPPHAHRSLLRQSARRNQSGRGPSLPSFKNEKKTTNILIFRVKIVSSFSKMHFLLMTCLKFLESSKSTFFFSNTTIYPKTLNFPRSQLSEAYF